MAVNPAQLAELSALLEQALDIPAAERLAWLSTPPTRDPEVLAALSRALQLPVTLIEPATPLAPSLTRTDQPPTDSRSAAAYWLRSGRFSEMGFSGMSERRGGADESIVAGATMDRYRLLHPIGSGGMGTVWLAERIDGDIVRPVALKLPLRLSGNRQIAERFTRERGVLAKLTHPNIATLYDAGVSDAGIPFLALEYVEGLSITDYADSKWLTVAARLTLFAQVLAAVQHAHQSLVIHRDLKPSNILVKADGTVKLLDFGIAKLIEEVDEIAEDSTQSNPEHEDSAQGELTRQVGVAITPNYASPEQLANASLTTATDVYSLGVVLYELLAGVRPYRLKQDNQAALLRDIRAADISPPSEIAFTNSTATLRRSTPAKLKRLLRGDLDAILLKALEKSTDTRYRTADEFAADLRKYQQHEPVQAMPSSRVYRLKKYVVRNRRLVAAVSAISLAIVIGVGATAWQLRETEREQARRNAVQNFLVGIFKTVDPEVARGKVHTAKEMLDIAVERIDKQFADQPEAAASLYGEIGLIFSALGDSKTASELLARKVRLLELMGQTASVGYVEALTRYGHYLHADRRIDAAVAPLEQAVARSPNFGSKDWGIRWDAMEHLARVQIERSEFLSAKKLLEQIQREMLPLPQAARPIRALWKSQRALCHLAFDRGDFMQVKVLLASVGQLQREDTAITSFERVEHQHDLAVVENETRDFTAAMSRVQKILPEAVKNYGENGKVTLVLKAVLAKSMVGLGRASEALAIQIDIVAATRLTGNIDNTEYAEYLLIRKLIVLGRYAEAERFAQKALDYFRSQASPSSQLTEGSRKALAEIYLLTNRLDRATTAGEQALNNLVVVNSENSLDTAAVRDVVGATFRAIGRLAEAEKMHIRAASAYETQLGVGHVLTLRSQIYLALARVDLNTPGAADEFDRAAKKIIAQLPTNHPAMLQLESARKWVVLPAQKRATTRAQVRLLDI